MKLGLGPGNVYNDFGGGYHNPPMRNYKYFKVQLDTITV